MFISIKSELYILQTGSTNTFYGKLLSMIMTLKTLGQGHQNLIISKACLSDVPANSEKINPLGQKIYPTYSMTLKKGPGHQQ